MRSTNNTVPKDINLFSEQGRFTGNAGLAIISKLRASKQNNRKQRDGKGE